MADDTINSRAARAKRLVISISHEERRNEPDLTLGHLFGLTQSIVDAFRSNKKVEFPNTYSLLLLDGDSQEINARGASFPLTLTHFKGEEASGGILGNAGPIVLGQFFPDDIAQILKSIKGFVIEEYGTKKNKTFSWGYEIDSIIAEISSAADIKSLQIVAQTDLKKAAEVTLEIIEGIHKEIADEAQLDLDNIQPIIAEIENVFRTATKHGQYRSIWEKFGYEAAKSLGDSPLNEKVIITPNHKFSVSDARTIINTYYEQIAEQYKKDKIESPWDRVTSDTREKFDYRTKEYVFNTNEVNNSIVISDDTNKARTFLKDITDLLDELEKEPETAAAGVSEDPGDDGGGEAQEPTPTEVEFTNQEKIIKDAIRNLKVRSSGIFFEYFSIEKDSYVQEQQDWLIKELSGKIIDLINEGETETAAENWIIDHLTPEVAEGDNYRISDDQAKQLDIFLAEWFFNKHRDVFLRLIQDIPLVEESKKESAPVETETPDVETVVPTVDGKTEDVEAEITKGLDIGREKQLANLATTLLFSQFGKEEVSQEIRNAINILILKEFPAGLSNKELKAEINRRRGEIFNKLQLNEEVFRLSKEHYQKRLREISQGSLVSEARIYATIDSIIVLSQDPAKYFAGLTDTDLLEHFGLQDSGINTAEFKKLLRGLISIRRYAAGANIAPWFDEDDEKKKIPQALGGVRTFVSEYEEDGVAALNLTPDQIDRSQTISEHRKATIKQLYKDLWLASVAGKTETELFDIYIQYGVSAVEIDYSAPPPGFTTFSDAAAQANLTGPAGQTDRASAAKKLFSSGKQNLGKAALGVIAPELAPILAALEQLPFLKDLAEEIEEKTGNLLLVTLGAGAGAVAALLKGGARALLGAVGGGLIGFALGGPGGAVVGAGLGGWLGGGGAKTIGDWFKERGISGGGAGLGPISQSGLGGIGGKTLATAPTTFKIAGAATAGGTMLAVAVAGGTQLHPTVITTNQTGEQSKYVTLAKTADVGREIETPPDEITYEITISADKGYSITINSAKDVTAISFSEEGKDSEKREKDISELNGTTIADGESITIEYTQEYGSEYMDSRITNSFSIDFDYQNSSESGSDTASTSYSVGIGDYPIGDGCWPTTGEFTQGPHGVPNKFGNSHSVIQAIDIHSDRGTPIFTPFDGEACAYPQDSGWLCAPSAISAFGTQYCYGNHVVLNAGTFTVGFAHMDAFSSELNPGECQDISAGTLIGTMGNSGLLNYGPTVGIHLHYELRPSSLNFNDYVPGPMEIHEITEICPN